MNAFRYNKCAWTFFFLSKTKRQSVFLSQYVNMFHVKPFCLKENWLPSVDLVRYSLYNAVQIYIIYRRRTWGSALVLYENKNIFWSRNAREPVCRAERMPETIDRRFVWTRIVSFHAYRSWNAFRFWHVRRAICCRAFIIFSIFLELRGVVTVFNMS